MTYRWLLILPLLVFGLGAGCGPSTSPKPEPIDQKKAPVVVPTDQPTLSASSPETPPPVPVAPSKPSPATAGRPTKYLPNCPGMSTQNPRVAGSNCFGILPVECGADKAKSYIGRRADAITRKIVTTQVGHENIRWIAPGEPVIENLDRQRLNMHLDKQGRVQKVDCY